MELTEKNKKKIVVIDDSTTVRKIIEKFLSKDYTLVFIDNSELHKTLDIIEKEEPSLVLLDVNLGENDIDGYQICREIRSFSKTPTVPVIMMSGTDEELDVVRAFKAGTNIFLRKPFRREELLNEVKKLIAEEKKVIKEKILIVDDSNALRAILRYELEQGGYDVIEERAGEKVLESAITNNPDLIIIDYEMEGIDGIEVSKILKSNVKTYGIPIVMLSSTDSPEIISRAFSAGIAEYFIKPFKKGELLSYIEELFSSFKTNKKSTVKALVVDDSKVQRASVVHILKKSGYRVFEAESGKEAIELASKNKYFDFIITDIFLKDINGVELSKQLKMINPKFIIIGVSSTRNKDTVVKALSSGMDEFVHLPVFEEELSLRIKLHLELKEKIENLREINKKLEEASTRDFLTNLFNRRYFMEKLENHLLMAEREGLSLSIAIFDIDYFKRINDTYGHDVGDTVLKKFAEVLEKEAENYYIVGRIGGEEFSVILPQTSIEDASKYAEKVRRKIENTEVQEIHPSRITVSGGISSTETLKTYDKKKLLIDADTKLYKAKKSGRNRIVF